MALGQRVVHRARPRRQRAQALIQTVQRAHR